jgi:2'-N-acetylparomamine deacetylase / 2'''-acetyl-6'''-hydroxyneomycin deacetylase
MGGTAAWKRSRWMEPGLELPEDWQKWPEIAVLSPHSDDAAFSVAGHLFYLSSFGKKVSLLTCFSRSMFTQAGALGDANSTTELRKQEDARYAATLGAGCSAAWFDLDDAPLRGYMLREVCHAREFTREERALAGRLEHLFLSLSVSPGSAVLAPLGIGSHIDHRIVHQAAAALAQSRRFRMVFYEDMPYSAGCQENEIQRRVGLLEQKLKGSLLPSRCETHGLLDLRRAAASCYPSQVRPEVLQGIFNASPPPARYAYERVWQLRRRSEGKESV